MYQRGIVLYTSGRSFRSWRARRFLRRQGYRFEAVDAAGDPKSLPKLSDAIRRKVMPPCIFVDDRPVGNLGVVRDLARSGNLEHLLRGHL